MQVSEEALTHLLERFAGRKVEIEERSVFKIFSLPFFPNNVNPNVQMDVPIDATLIYSQYKAYHQREKSSFNAFLYYNLIQTMQQPEFACLRYRYLNDEWYCFDNLPFFVSVKINDPAIQQVDFFLENVGTMSWPDFVQAYTTSIAERRAIGTGVFPEDISWYGMSHLITTIPSAFSGYTPSQKASEHNAHAPWFVCSKREEKEDGVVFTLSCTVSHASTLPSELTAFISAFQENLLTVPEQQKLTSYFPRLE
ncbi:MAG: hypothetical protein K0U37_03940 [Gammaproteobacteria bacterium]|nr:hypothetical protein [Gammaproteobacteria bacterium]